MEKNGGSLYLRGTQISSLPDNLTVGGGLYLSGTRISSLPDNLTVGGGLYLSGTQITALPDNLTVGFSLCLGNSEITTLPSGLVVGGSLDLSDTKIDTLPNDLLTVYGIRCNEIIPTEEWYRATKKRLQDGDYVEGRYLYCDGILTHVKRKREVNGYTLYIGKIKGRNVVSDGKYYAHCETFREGIEDIAYKRATDRGAEQFAGLSLDTALTVQECVAMYRIITGACRAGSEAFVSSLGELKERYTIAEMLEITREQYNYKRFAEFFGR